jgi:hypothetical protein
MTSSMVVAYEDLEKVLANDNKVKVAGELTGSVVLCSAPTDLPILILFPLLLPLLRLLLPLFSRHRHRH